MWSDIIDLSVADIDLETYQLADPSNGLLLANDDDSVPDETIAIT